jgi:HD-GYP domain-containing protein (c-di-GMP phosphodiesterase class II)
MEASRLDKVSTRELEVGMYVDRLDRPWTETRFLFQGFSIRSQEEIEELRRYCEFVYVDRFRESEAPAAGKPLATGTPVPAHSSSTVASPGFRQPVYPNTVPVEKEISAARAVYSDALGAAKTLITGMLQSGRLDIDLARHTITPMMESMLRNPDALIWLTRMRQQDSYLFNHALNTSIWGLAFARHMGVDKQVIYEIGLGCMLFDVGKTQLPLTLLLKPGPLTTEELELAQSHVAHSRTIIKGMDGVTPRIMDLVRAHHERFDGSGYPAGLKSDDIPPAARLAGIVDCYDALISFRPYAVPQAPDEALKLIFSWRDKLFDAEMVEEFMQVVGVFPTGSLVELNSGAVGMIIAQNENNRRLRPRIALLTDNDKQRMPYTQVVDMLYDSPWSDSSQFWIDRCLQPGAYGISPETLEI